MKRFNYIVTIHNKEFILERTLDGIAACCSPESRIYTVLDGCTDGSEKIVDDFIARTGLNVEKIYTPDVHEILSINAALRKIEEGFTICLQDDVILQGPRLEEKIEKLYKEEGPTLGVISFCRAANLRRTPFLRQLVQSGWQPLVSVCDHVQAPHEQHHSDSEKAEYEQLVYRMVAIKSPVCIPEDVLRTIGILDENMAPYSWDDPEYCMRSLKAGFQNALFPLRFVSKLEWGGTRIDKSFPRASRAIHLRNRRYIWEKHGQFIKQYWERLS